MMCLSIITNEVEKMKIILNKYQHQEKEFVLEVTTCNKRVATTKNVETGEVVKFNRSKFEWMISKGIFKEIN